MYAKHEEQSFLSWMRKSNQFFTGDEYQARLGIFLANKRLVQEHNGKSSFTVSLNKFAAMTPAEYKSMLGFKRIQHVAEGNPSSPNADSCDWRDKGCCNAIQDQGQCGSCWAFSTIQSAEGVYAAKSGKLLKLSEQNLVDCVTTCEGCDGGFMTYSFDYVKKSQGGKFMYEKDYPYVAYDQSCKFDASKGVSIGLKGYAEVKSGSEDDLAAKCEKYGPIAIAIDASNWSFQMYSGGIYDEPACSSQNLDHGVGCVGFGKESGKAYWIVRNSWGEDWGEKGYIRMIKGSNQCGEATMGSYPTL